MRFVIVSAICRRRERAGPLRLRAERIDGAGQSGRVYLIRVQATDSSNNVRYKCVPVVVPGDNSGSAISSVTGMALAAANQCTATGIPPTGCVPVGVGPLLGPKQ